MLFRTGHWIVHSFLDTAIGPYGILVSYVESYFINTRAICYLKVTLQILLFGGSGRISIYISQTKEIFYSNSGQSYS